MLTIYSQKVASIHASLDKISLSIQDLPSIVQYNIMDAYFSKNHKVEIEQARFKWNQHVQEAKRVRKEVEQKSWTNEYKELYFGISMLNYIRFGTRDLRKYEVGTSMACPYRHNARNFIVAIAGKPEEAACVCSSYAFYIDALANLENFQPFYTSTCRTDDNLHIFNIVLNEQDSTARPMIGYDAGYNIKDFQNPYVILFTAPSIQLPNDFPLKAMRIDRKNTFDWKCQDVLKEDRVFQNLMAESWATTTLEKATRNALFIEYLFPAYSSLFHECIQYRMLQEYFYSSLFEMVDSAPEINLTKWWESLLDANETLFLKETNNILQGQRAPFFLLFYNIDTLTSVMTSVYLKDISSIVSQAIYSQNRKRLNWVKYLKHLLQEEVQKIQNRSRLEFFFLERKSDSSAIIKANIRIPCQRSVKQDILQCHVIQKGETRDIPVNANILCSKEVHLPHMSMVHITQAPDMILPMPTTFIVAYWQMLEPYSYFPFSF
jgi:hypothetical protein